jgi:hypothetical protein
MRRSSAPATVAGTLGVAGRWLSLLILCCGLLDVAEAGKKSPVRGSEVTREQIVAADLSVLFIGNSHTRPIPEALVELAREHDPSFNIVAVRAEGIGFLVDHARTESTRQAIVKGPWDVVVLQAQKYSSSGRHHYPYDGAIELTRLARENGSRVVMFPEWGRRGMPDEAARVQRIHEEIAARTGATVAPVGIAWDRALAERPRLRLHAADGNHASRLGDCLTACVLYAVLTGKDPRPAGTADGAELDRREFLALKAFEAVSGD